MIAKVNNGNNAVKKDVVLMALGTGRGLMN